MKKICSFLLMFALLGAMVIAVVVPTIPAKAEEGPIWPCEGSQNVQTQAELDKTFILNPSAMGSSDVNFDWVGSCAAVELKSSIPVSYSRTYKMRIASDQVLGTFYISSDYGRVMGYLAVDVSSNFVLYVPDSRLGEFQERGLSPVPFSQVTDWSWEAMMGASQNDTTAQWIGRDIKLGSVYTYRSELVFGMLGAYNPANFFLTWREQEQEYNIYLPVIMH